MNYIVDIIDTLNDTLLTKDEKAVASSVVLDWKGGDLKDDLEIIGSSLAFTMAGMSCEDGQYIDLFTGDETRFKVRLYNEEDVTLWNGFILPDQYSEPYNDNPILIDFLAVDGLGRLKGKYLPDTFYEDENSVIDILANCLLLTGLELNIRFAPAIQNTFQPDYKLVYLDGLRWIKNDKKDDAYKILQDLLGQVNCIYQADNHWNFEGLNIRNLRVYNTTIYSPQGGFIEEQEITRLSKDITALAVPTITMQPPYGLVNISHKREDVNLPKTLSREENDGWVLTRKSVYSIYATDWFGDLGFYAKAANYKNMYLTTSNLQSRPEYAVFFGRQDGNFGQLSLRTKPYLVKGNKYRLDLDFTLFTYSALTEEQREARVAAGDWKDPFYLDITISTDEGTEIIFRNSVVDITSPQYIPQAFNADGEMVNQLEFIPNQSGLLDIKVNGVIDLDNGIEFIHIAKAELKTIAFEETRNVNIELQSDYTIRKDIELDIASDQTAFSWAYRLAKLRTKNNFNQINIPIIRQQLRDGFWYASVSLAGANLIKDNIEDVYNNGVIVPVLDVIYNWKNSEEFMVKLANDITFGDFEVKVYDYNSITENRDYWEYWTDSLYKVERIPYVEALGNVYNRSFNIPLPKVDFNVKNSVKINDFLNFTFIGKKSFLLTNCKWDIDNDITTVTASEAYYAVTAGQNIPPVVEAGNNLTIGDGITQIQLTSDAYDPDGFIVSYLWEELTNNGAIITNPSDQNVQATNLTGDFYTFQVTVTDNDGATATDTVDVYRVQPHALILTETIVTDLVSVKERTYQIGFDPNIAEGAALNIKGTFYIEAFQNPPFSDASVFFKIKVDNVYLRDHQEGAIQGATGTATYLKGDDFSLSYFNGQVIIIEIFAEANVADPGGQEPFANATFTIETIDFIDGFGSITNLPQTKAISV